MCEEAQFSLTEPLVATAVGGRREGFCKSLISFELERGKMMSPTVESFRKAYGSRPFFNEPDDYEKFRIRFGDTLRPDLEKNREARRKSEEAARNRFLL